MTLKVGDIITKKRQNAQTDNRKVLGICGDVVFLSYSFDYEKTGDCFTEKELLEDGWVFPKTKWEPKDRQQFWFLDASLNVTTTTFDISYADIFHVGNCFQTKEEAKQARDRVLLALKG